ncbi:hypothetical protein BGZ57DRAFT_974389 [Hyaloscypha finlandica]|nr:hypothetical protein BGZ57DRAFT_974389 [Hyaloscypha finlandica]
MPPDPQGTEPGPLTGAVFFVFDSSSERGSNVRISQPGLLRSRSLGLRKLMDERGVKQEIPLRVDLSTDIDCTAVEWVVKELQQQKPDIDPDPKGLARHCVVLWKYQCIPDLWNSQEKSIILWSSSSSMSSTEQQSSATPSRAPRFWQGRKKYQTCRQLITIAIVLGLRKILEEEIKTAVWGTNKEMDIIVPLGVNIKAIRESELWKLFTCVYQKIAEISDGNEKLAKSIRETLKQHNLGDFVQTWKSKQEELGLWTPYDFLLGLDNALSPLELQTQESAPVGVRDLRPINWDSLFRKVRDTLHMNSTRLGQEKKAAILEAIEVHICERQRELATALMTQRDSTVREWKDKLRWKEPLLELDPSNQKYDYRLLDMGYSPEPVAPNWDLGDLDGGGSNADPWDFQSGRTTGYHGYANDTFSSYRALPLPHTDAQQLSIDSPPTPNRDTRLPVELAQGLLTEEGLQHISGFGSSMRAYPHRSSTTNDPSDPKAQAYLADLLEDTWQCSDTDMRRRGRGKAASALVEYIQTLFSLPSNGSITVCKWEAPRAFRQWYGDLKSPDGMSHAETSAAFQKSLLILGSDPYFEATTIEDFIFQTYDSTGRDILGIVTDAFASAIKGQKAVFIDQETLPLETIYTRSKFGTKSHLLLFEEYVILGRENQKRSGNAESECLLRLSQALRCRPPKLNYPPQVWLSIPLIDIVNTDSPEYDSELQGLKYQASTLLPLELIEVKISSCWTNLFQPAPVAVAFNGLADVNTSKLTGLKLPFDLMLHLAAIQTVTLVSGTREIEAFVPATESQSNSTRMSGFQNDNRPSGYVLSGFFTALIPIEESGDFVRWHLEYKKPDVNDAEGELIDPHKLSSTSGNSWLRVADYETLRQKGCVLGWWDEANVMLGTKELPNHVRFSKPSSTKSRSLHFKEISTLLQMGASTPVSISIQARANFQFVSNVQHFPRDNIYAMALRKMAYDIALVYDGEEHRGWLVPKLSLILHMSHSYYNTVISPNISTNPIPYAQPSSDGAAAALAALQGKGDTILYNCGSDGDILLSSIISTIHANICEANKTREPSKSGKLLTSQYMDMILEPAGGSNITITKAPSSIDTWLGIIDRVGCVIVCAALGEAIQPIVTQSRCTKGCDRLPSGKGYLAAHFWCLEKLLQRRGWELVALQEQAVGINDSWMWALRGDAFSCCVLAAEHKARWETKTVVLQTVSKAHKWKNKSVQNTVPRVTGAAVFGIPGQR